MLTITTTGMGRVGTGLSSLGKHIPHANLQARKIIAKKIQRIAKRFAPVGKHHGGTLRRSIKIVPGGRNEIIVGITDTRVGGIHGYAVAQEFGFPRHKPIPVDYFKLHERVPGTKGYRLKVKYGWVQPRKFTPFMRPAFARVFPQVKRIVTERIIKARRRSGL